MSFQRTIQNDMYFQYALYTLKLVVAHNASQLIHLICLSIKVKQMANLVCRRHKIWWSRPVKHIKGKGPGISILYMKWFPYSLIFTASRQS